MRIFTDPLNKHLAIAVLVAIIVSIVGYFIVFYPRGVPILAFPNFTLFMLVVGLFFLISLFCAGYLLSITMLIIIKKLFIGILRLNNWGYSPGRSIKNFDLSIVTNGTLLDSKKIECIHDLGLMGSVQISMDSNNEHIHNSVRGSFSKTMSSLKKIKEMCDDLPTIGIVLHKQNYCDICNSLEFLSDYCSGFHLMNVMCSKKSLENRNLLFLDYATMANTWNKIDRFCKKNSISIDIHNYDLKNKETARFTGCTAGKTKVAITPELNVIPCDMTRSLIIGNMNNDTLSNVWNSEKADEIRNLDIEPCHELNSKLIIAGNQYEIEKLS